MFLEPELSSRSRRWAVACDVSGEGTKHPRTQEEGTGCLPTLHDGLGHWVETRVTWHGVQDSSSTATDPVEEG